MLDPSIVRTMLPTAWMSPGLPPWVRKLFKVETAAPVLAVTDQRNRAGDVSSGSAGVDASSGASSRSASTVATAASKNQRPLAGVGV